MIALGESQLVNRLATGENNLRNNGFLCSSLLSWMCLEMDLSGRKHLVDALFCPHPTGRLAPRPEDGRRFIQNIRTEIFGIWCHCWFPLDLSWPSTTGLCCVFCFVHICLKISLKKQKTLFSLRNTPASRFAVWLQRTSLQSDRNVTVSGFTSSYWWLMTWSVIWEEKFSFYCHHMGRFCVSLYGWFW